MHVDLAHRVVLACNKKGVKRLLQMSALNASKEAHSYYLRSKGEAEDWVHHAVQNGLQVTSFRPSVIFGPADSFFNRFAGLLEITPFVFPLACAKSRFAPVYIGDVSMAFCIALEDPHTIGQHYSLCGPQIFTLQELVQYTAQQLQLKTKIIALPNFLSRLQARILGLLPSKPFTLDNYRSLQTDSVCSENGLITLGIKPVSIHAVVPSYLGHDNRKGRLDRYRKQRPFNVQKRL
jgi:NADH dehydrogenase